MRSRHRATLVFVDPEALSKSYGGMGSQIASKNNDMHCITCIAEILNGMNEANELSRRANKCSEKSL